MSNAARTADNGPVVTNPVERARAGDERAFGEVVGGYRGELQLHCYRILGSFHDAEDAVQETLLAAWQGLDRFEGRSSIRTWLYSIATNRCLNVLRASRQRWTDTSTIDTGALPRPTRSAEVWWIEPYPDALLEGLPDRAPGPEARYETREAISLAFVTALQLLPPRQRAVHILRDVLGFHAREVAELLDSTEESVTSALKRARATLEVRLPASDPHARPPLAGSPAEQALAERFTHAFQGDDIEDLVRLLTDEVWISMPPIPFEWQGREPARQVLGAVLEPGRRLVPTRANGQPAFGLYLREPHARRMQAVGLLVLTLAGDRVAGITRFDAAMLGYFKLPETLST